MAEESYEDRQNQTVKDFEDHVTGIREQAEADRASAKVDEGETEEEYRARIGAVPGIFGDTDTTFGSDVVAADNETATVAVAEAEVAAEEGDKEAAEQVASGAARRQPQAQATGETAEEVDEAATAEESSDDDDDDNSGEESDEDADDTEKDEEETA